MTHESRFDDTIAQERQMLIEAQQRGPLGRIGTYAKLSGPGWLASAITLGGGSLASSLYLGVIGGYSLMWLQPLAMVLGVIMLSTIGYVTLSSGKRPFPAINEHISPVLGWSWALAVAAANIIWCMPQQSIAYGVLSQNLLPKGWFGPEGAIDAWASNSFGHSAPWLASNFDEFAVAFCFLVLCTTITWSYDRGGWGLRLYETALKIVVAMIVLCFFGVVIKLSTTGSLDWDAIWRGFIPDFGQFFRPAGSFAPFLDAIGAPGEAARDYWQSRIVADQRDVIISAAATAVGINMTFMYPYSMLRKGWGKSFRGLARFDLATGMFIPFMLATSCVVIAAAARFHTELPLGFSDETNDAGQTTLVVDKDGPKYDDYLKILGERKTALAKQTDAAKLDDADETGGADKPSDAEQRLAAMLVKRDAFDLASALEPVTGKRIANYVFGFGVLAMVLSTISVLMLISGFVFAEMTGYPPGGTAHKLGTLVAGVGGAMWPVFWQGGSQVYLAVVTSVFGFMLLPFAYVTFAALLNSRSLLGDEMPRGGRRVVVNLLVFSSAALATVAAIYMIHVKTGVAGLVGLAAILVLVLLVHLNRCNEGGK